MFTKYLPDLNGRQWKILFVFAVSNFIAGMVYSLKGPFYPHEAELKGLTPSQYGFVFGIFDFSKIFLCPLAGKYIPVLGPKKVFISSMILISICSVAFGLLEKINNQTAFFAVSLIIRVSEAIGSAGFSTSSFSITACEFPDTVGNTFASLETFFGIGLIVGPLLGGWFYQIGGYDAPFIVTGLLFFTASLTFLSDSLMPHPWCSSQRNTGAKLLDGKPNLGILDILKIPGVILAAFGVFTAASSVGFINATLEPHIREFELSPVGIGGVFLIYGAIYGLFAPPIGWACDRIAQPYFALIAGGVSNFFAFLLIGPAPFLGLSPSLWFVCLGLVFHGLALGFIFVSGFVLCLRYAKANGFPNDMTTSGIVTGCWASAMSLGMFFGPVIGGVLLDQVGFSWGSVFVLISMIILILLVISFLMSAGINIRNMDNETPEAEQPLLLKSEADDPLVSLSPKTYGSNSVTVP